MFTHGDIEVTHYPTASTLADLARALAHDFDGATAVIGEHDQLTFGQLLAAADQWADALEVAGYGPGSNIGLLAGNGPQWLAIAFGIWRCGATLVPISTFVTPRELAATITHADICVLVAQPALRAHSYRDALTHVGTLPSLRTIVVLSGPCEEPAVSAGQFLAAGSRLERRTQPRPVATESIACMLYTSGTTGDPKGVMLSHAAILATVGPTAQRTGLSSSDTLLSTLPLFWVAGLVIRALPTLATGCALVLPETFTTEIALQLLRRHRPTALHLRPPQVGQILGHADFRPDMLSAVSKGGGRSTWYAPHLTEARLITGYGMTEMAGYVTALDSRDAPELLQHSIGTPLPGVEIRVVDEQGRACAAGTNGEIHVRGPGMFSGYYKQPLSSGRSDDGWFVTGDLGSIAADGTFHFSGRSKDLLRIKGINVSPVEVEAILSAHPDVEAAYVVGLPPDGLDQRLVALIVAKSRIPEDDLRSHAATQLSHYKRPEDYVFVERSQIVLGGTSKPQRAQLAELAQAALSSRAET